MMTQSAPFEIVSHSPEWARAFEEERARLLQLANCPFLELEHIGSTSVPGLSAKPVIDIMASVDGLEDIDAVQSALWALGYEDLDAGFQFRRAFHRPADADYPAFNLHIVRSEDWAHKSERLFRDWLKTHPDVARAYQDLKIRIAECGPETMMQYTRAKGDFIQSAVNDARRAVGLPERSDWRE
ncbi:GrpB family protein [Roseibium sp.]|uniref:GrpB family protein n=1 Tax=Roseibium sp. TaxID=1936156 RepID=UPI003D0F8C37